MRNSKFYMAKKKKESIYYNTKNINNVITKQLSWDTSSVSQEFTNHANLDNFGLESNQLS